MIHFLCENCGYKFSAPQAGIGENIRCPDCKNITVVSEVDSEGSILDPNLFDIPHKSRVTTQGDVSEKALENLRKLKSGESEPPPKRKLFWLIDIFLYPASKTCLIMLGVFIGIKLLMKILGWALESSESPLSPLYALEVSVAVASLYVELVILLYVFWYFCECIHDSAYGGVRAPETVASFGELGQALSLVMTWMVFWLPAILYTLVKYPPFEMLGVMFTLPEGETPIGVWLHIIRNDTVFSLLWFYAIYFFPMALLSVILFDSLSGLNPMIIIPSILSTFFRYFLVVIVFYIPLMTLFGILDLRACLPEEAFRFGLLGLLLYFAWVWLLLVVGHLTGRYYYRNDKKLYWDV